MDRFCAYRTLKLAGLVVASLAWTASARAAEPAPAAAAPAQHAADPVPDAGKDPAREILARRGDLTLLQDEMKLSDETLARLRGEIGSLGADRDKLHQQLVDTGNQTHDTEARALTAEARLASLDSNEDNIRVSLQSRRALLIEVLASLERMGRNPPPAMLVSPDDALQAVRTSMLLGAVLPEMRQETETLIGDLRELARVRAEITAERDVLKQALQSLAENRTRTELLVEERQKVLAQEQTTLAAEQAHTSSLAQQAANLKDLIARMERDSVPAQQAATSANAAPASTAGPPTKASLAALQDPSRLTPALPFEQARGMLSLPVTGAVLRDFGADDGNGGQEKGLTIATTPESGVTAPCDGWVVFAGTFRSYGRLLIINAGGGYHIVMAGMDKINVGLGQFVLTGEPVGVMGAERIVGNGAIPGADVTKVALAGSSSATRPTLYVEFRKDGVSIDPTPWWSNQGEKARG